jgi:hypothetical protein
MPYGNWTLGLDVGMIADHSALALCEVREERQPWPREAEPVYKHLIVNNLKRWGLPCFYPILRKDIHRLVHAADLQQIYGGEQIFANVEPVLRSGVRLVIDASGAGSQEIVRFFEDAHSRRQLGTSHPYYLWITGGQVPSKGNHVSRGDLLRPLQLLAQEDRLHIAPGLGLADTLIDELRHLQLKKSPTGEDVYESVGKHDDIAISVALAYWGSYYSGECVPWIAPEACTVAI